MIYVSMNLTGTEVDIPRAEALRRQILNENKVPFIPVLLFREVSVIPSPFRDEVIQAQVHIMEICDEVWIYDDPKASIACSRDKQLALAMGIPIILKYQDSRTADKTFGEILQYYQLQLGSFPAMKCIEDIRFYLNKGLSAQVIKESIKIGIERQKPWVYIEAILKNCLHRGIFTAEDMEKSKKTKQSVSDKSAKYDLGEFERRLAEGVI